MVMTKGEIIDGLKNKSYQKWLFLGIIAVLVILLALYINLNENGITADNFENEINSDNDEYVSFQPIGGTRNGITFLNVTDPCIECHVENEVLEAVMYDWSKSEHALNNVTCIDCHEANQNDPDAIDHGNYYITHIVSPQDCAKCHPNETAEFGRSLHSLGGVYYEFLYNNKKLPFLESQLEGEFITVEGEEIKHGATIRGCQSCHGTNMTGKSIEDFTVWPNNGIGRINPDGSKGSCSACHSRHSFSKAEARHPETCGQCHMGPDHPHIEIYMESKHGNIYSAEGESWNWSSDNWEAGIDYRSPTCAACHMSAAQDVPATHDVSSRLSWELESAVSKHTDNTANSLGVPISDGSTWQEKRGRMEKVCEQCHSDIWTENYYEQADLVVDLYNEKYLEAKAIVDELYDEGLLTKKGFDEEIEFKIYEMWHHEGRRARIGAFMMGPDYVQWHGFYELLQDRVEIEHMAEELRSQVEEMDERSMVFLATNGPGTNLILKWDISHPAEVDHYEIYWDTSLISNVTSKSPNTVTEDDSFVVKNLTKGTIYYFTIVAVDGDGNSTAMAFSSAMPVELHEMEGDEDSDDAITSETLAIILIVIIIIIIVLLFIGSAAQARRRNQSETIDEEKKRHKKRKNHD
jgi:formate-dependent nitrite reductase cytochrome c552 subunit